MIAVHSQARLLRLTYAYTALILVVTNKNIRCQPECQQKRKGLKFPRGESGPA